MASSDMMIIVVMMMMMSSVFAVLAGGAFFLTRPEEGDECKGEDENGNYVIDEDGKCVLDYCDTGYYKSGKKCLEDKSGDSCEPTGTKDPQGVYLTNQLGECDLSDCNMGYTKSGTTCIVEEGESESGGSPEVRNVPESMRSASSVRSGEAIGVGHGRGRIDSPQGWSAQNNTIGEWYQIDNGKIANITGVVIQGRKNADQWVTTFRVKYRGSGETWSDMDSGAIYTGNADRDTKVEVTFTTPVNARYIRIYPETWNGHMSLRAGIISSSTNANETATIVDVPEAKRSASSIWSGEPIGTGHGRGRLDSPQGWSAQNNTIGEWYEMETDTPTMIKGIAIKGRGNADQWVTTFKVKYIDSSGSWVDVDDGMLFQGNRDRGTQVNAFFNTPLNTSFIRIYPQTWNGHMSLRVDLIK